MARRNQAEIVLTARDRTKSAFKAVNASLGRFAALGLAGAAAGVVLLTKRSLQQIDALAKQSQLLGITTEKLAAFQLVSAKTGIEQKTLEKSLINVTRVVAEAAEGTGLATDTLKKLGLEARALSQLSPDEQFLQIAEAMKGVNTQSEKVLAAYELFGGRGAALLRTLEAGTAGFEEAEEKTLRFGTAISAVDAASIEEANDAFTDLSESVKGLGFDLARRFAPGMKDANEGLAGFVVTVRRDFIPAMALLFEQLGILQNNVRGLSDIELGVRVIVAEDDFAELAAREQKFLNSRITQHTLAVDKETASETEIRKLRLVEWQKEQFELERQAVQDRLDLVTEEQERRADIILTAEGKLQATKAAQVEEARLAALEKERESAQEAFDERIERQSEETQAFIEGELDRARRQRRIRFDEAREEQRAMRQQAKLEERSAQQTIRLRQATASTSIRILQVLVGKNKTVARALFLVEKGLAIARTIQNTAAASVKALAELGPIAGPPAAGAIQAFGAAQVGLIAATALTGVGAIGGGGGLGGLGTGGGFGSGEFSGGDAANDPAPSSGGAGVQEQGVVQLIFPNVFGITPDAIDAIADALREASENRDVVIVSGQGRNAEILAGANG
jgi:hypothetical protein